MFGATAIDSCTGNFTLGSVLYFDKGPLCPPQGVPAFRKKYAIAPSLSNNNPRPNIVICYTSLQAHVLYTSLMLSTLFTHPLAFLVFSLGLVLAISVHEFAHAASADRLGDPTPRSMGRLTLNPLAHLDPLGTLALLFLGFGWGRPVSFDPYNLRSPRRDSALIALAGPASNLLFALVLSILLKIFPNELFVTIGYVLISMNITLAVFNLVPVYPLDGEKILGGLLSPTLYREYASIMQQYGTMILILMLLPIAGGVSPISALISPVISFVTKLLL